jgi:hypothetical protein
MKAIFALLLSLAGIARAQETALLLSHQASNDVEPNAVADADFWRNAKAVMIERNILGAPATNLHAEVRSRWTKDHLYLLFIGHYDRLNLRTNPVASAETYRLWFYDCFEAYIGADLSQTNRYREFQMSPQGEFLDLDIDSSKPRPGYNGEQNWSSGMKVKARVDDAKKIWIGDMRIPMSALRETPPKPGDEFRVNFCRQDGTGRERTFLAWQPTGAWTPHRPEKFGKLRLVGDKEPEK